MPEFQIKPKIYRLDYLVCRALSEQIKAEISRLKGQKLKILDVGCGDKPYYPLFKDIAKSYTGLDVYSGEKVDIISPAEKIPFKQNSFDVVVCFQVLEHIENPEKAISEMHRVLKEGGLLLLSTHGSMHTHNCPSDYWRWTEFGLKKIFSKFKDVEVLDNARPMASFFYIINIYLQRMNVLYSLTPLMTLNNIIGRKADDILPEFVTKSLFVVIYFVRARK